MSMLGVKRDIETENAIATIEKELKALEIIENKCVNAKMLKHSSGLGHFNMSYMDEYKLTQQEYDLLKEVLE